MSKTKDNRPKGAPKQSILLINRTFPPQRGASGRLLRDLSLAFAKDGWHVNVVCASPSRQSVEKHKILDIHVYRVKTAFSPKTVAFYLLTLWRLYRKAASLPPHDLVISMTDPPFLILPAARISSRTGGAHIHWCQDLYPDLLPVLGTNVPAALLKLLDKMTCRALKRCDRIVVVGRDMAARLVSKGIAPARISVIPNWPDRELFRHPSSSVKSTEKNGKKGSADFSAQVQEDGKPDQRKTPNKAEEGRDTTKQSPMGSGHSAVPEIRGLPPGREPVSNLFKDKKNPRFRVLYAGNIGLAHPMDTILETAEILNRDHPEIEFVFVGDGPGFDDIARRRALRDLSNIRLVPFQPAHRLRELMESGDIHLISMRHDSCGMLVPSKIYSALAVGRPSIFIGPEESEVGTLIKDFKAGLIVRQGESARLAELIKYYRYNGEAWFTAQHGAQEAGRIFVPRESLIAWLKRSHLTLRQHQEEESLDMHKANIVS